MDKNVKVLVYCTECNKFNIVSTTQSPIGYINPWGNEMRCDTSIGSSHKFNRFEIISMDREKYSKDDTYKNISNDSYFESTYKSPIEFSCKRINTTKRISLDILFDTYNKHNQVLCDAFLDELNEIGTEILEYETNEIKVNFKEKLKKDRYVFYIDDIRQKGWKQNVKNNFSRSIDTYLSDSLSKKEITRFYIIYGNNFFNLLESLENSPCLEIIYNAGFFENETNKYSKNNIMKTLLYQLKKNGKCPAEIFKTSKSNVKFLRNVSNNVYSNVSFSDAITAIQLTPNFEEREFVKIKKIFDTSLEYSNNSGLSRGTINFRKYISMFNMVKNHNYKLDLLVKYIVDDTKELQGFYNITEVIDTLEDYIDISVNLGLKFEKFPKALKMEHDKVVYLKLLKADEYNKEMFANALAINEVFNYSNKKFSIISPLAIMDLKNEGSALSHCVGTYVEKYCTFKSRIYFMRRIDEPEKPYVTVELDQAFSLRQSKGFANRSITVEERTFINEWIEFIESELMKSA